MKQRSRRLNVLLVGVDAGFRGMLREFLEFDQNMRVVGEISNGLDVVRNIQALKPDCVLIDLSVPDVERVRDAREAKERFPEIAVAILTEYEPEGYTTIANMIGVDAVLKKDFIISELPRLLKKAGEARPGTLAQNGIPEKSVVH